MIKLTLIDVAHFDIILFHLMFIARIILLDLIYQWKFIDINY